MGSELVPITPQAGVMVDPTRKGLELWGGVDLTTMEGKILAVRVVQEDAKSMKDVLNLELTIVNAVCHAASRVDAKTGEVSDWPRTVLVLADGSLVDCGSQGVHKSVGLASMIYGAPPWPDGIKVIPTAKDVGEGKNWYHLAFPGLTAGQTAKKAKK